jgi:serine/threonine-protein kinase RsbW
MSDATIVLGNNRREIERLSTFVEQFGEACHLHPDDISALNLVLDEIIINVMVHGYGDGGKHAEGRSQNAEDRRQNAEDGAGAEDIHVSLSLDGDLLTIHVEDTGRPFDPAAAPPPNLDLPLEERPVGGLGIHIVRSLTDRLEHQRIDDRNVLLMTRRVSVVGGR